MIEITTNGGLAVTGESIDFMRMVVIEQCMKVELETGGTMKLTRHAPKVWRIAKEEYGLKGTKHEIYQKFKALRERASTKQERIHIMVLKAQMVQPVSGGPLKVLLSNEKKEIDHLFDDKEVVKRMRGAAKKYFHAHVLIMQHKLEIELGAEAPDQPW